MNAVALNLAAEREARAANSRQGFHPDLGHGYGFEDNAGRVPKTEPDAVLDEVSRREDERLGVKRSIPPSVVARESDLQFIRELFDSVCLEDVRSLHKAASNGFKGGGQKRYSESLRNRIGLKFLLLVWLVEPSFLSADGNPISLTQLAKLLGMTAPALSPITAELSARLGIRNNFQLHDSKSEHAESKRALDGDEDEGDLTADGESEDHEPEEEEFDVSRN